MNLLALPRLLVKGVGHLRVGRGAHRGRRRQMEGGQWAEAAKGSIRDEALCLGVAAALTVPTSRLYFSAVVAATVAV